MSSDQAADIKDISDEAVSAGISTMSDREAADFLLKQAIEQQAPNASAEEKAAALEALRGSATQIVTAVADDAQDGQSAGGHGYSRPIGQRPEAKGWKHNHPDWRRSFTELTTKPTTLEVATVAKIETVATSTGSGVAGALAVLGLAGIGALVAGPVGAAVGGIIGLVGWFFSKKSGGRRNRKHTRRNRRNNRKNTRRNRH